MSSSIELRRANTSIRLLSAPQDCPFPAWRGQADWRCPRGARWLTAERLAESRREAPAGFPCHARIGSGRKEWCGRASPLFRACDDAHRLPRECAARGRSGHKGRPRQHTRWASLFPGAAGHENRYLPWKTMGFGLGPEKPLGAMNYRSGRQASREIQLFAMKFGYRRKILRILIILRRLAAALP